MSERETQDDVNRSEVASTLEAGENALGLELKEMMSALSSVEIDPHEFDGCVVEKDKVDWYTSRFKMLCDDGVPTAINDYLAKLLNEDVNPLTRVVILHAALQVM